jgi:hypothetical protein
MWRVKNNHRQNFTYCTVFFDFQKNGAESLLESQLDGIPVYGYNNLLNTGTGRVKKFLRKGHIGYR